MHPHQSSLATYTTIPISLSFSTVISRSLHNLTTTLSCHLRPWPDLLGSGAGSYSRPDSFPARARSNLRYFLANYSFVVAAACALSLLTAPFSLVLLSVIIALWILLYLFREDPLVLWGHSIPHRWVPFCLVGVSILAVWVCGVVENLVIGFVLGCLVCGVHAIFRNPDGLYLEENDAVSLGLVRCSGSPS
ncbi:hypothetical protein SLA2020_015060 [Shorea laevis]